MSKKVLIHENQVTLFPTDANAHRFQLRRYQKEAVDAMMAALDENDRHPACIAATGGGKCLGKDTPVLLYDGRVVPVQDVQVGDLLMGPDSQPRKVLSLAQGREMLYRIIQDEGDAYVVNESHILSLKDGERTVNLHLLDVLRLDEAARQRLRGWRCLPCWLQPSTIQFTAIRIEPAGEGDYYGFEIAGPDRLFLLGDFTVTHNTIIMAAFIERYLRQYPDESVLVLAHRSELITQAAERFSHVLPHDLVPAIHCASLNKKDFGKVTVASVQTIGKPDVLANMPAQGLVIVDEAHRIPLEGDGQYQRLFKTLGARHRDMRVAGFTATPWRLDGGHIVAPGNPLNHTAYQIEPALLMDEGFLVRPQWAKTLYPIETGKAHSRKGDFLNEDLRSAAAIQHKERMQDLLTRTADRSRTIVFTIDRKHARLVADSLPQSVVIDGNTATDVREQRIRDFADGKCRYLVNVDLFIEGFDLPKMDAVAVLRPTESAARWIQMVGRGLRTAEGKTDCLVLDYGGNLERFPMRPDEPGFFRYDPKGQGGNVPGTLVQGPANPEVAIELPAPLTHDVSRVDATVFHSNHKDRDFLKLRYFVGLTAVEQVWVVPSKDFADFWGRHGFGDVPKTPQEAMGRVRDGDLILPRAVSLRYRANPDKAFGYSEIVSEVHSWAETMANRHTFFSVPGHPPGESPGYRKGVAPSTGVPTLPGATLIRPTPIYGQKVYAALVDREAVPNSGQWVTAYPTPDSQPVVFEKPMILFNNRTGMSYVAEKAELDRMLQNKLSFHSWRKTALVPGIPLSFDGPVSLLVPHEMGNLGYLCAQRQLFDAARSWWEQAAARGDTASQKNLNLLAQWHPEQQSERRATIVDQGTAFAYGGGRRP